MSELVNSQTGEKIQFRRLLDFAGWDRFHFQKKINERNAI